MSSTLALPPTLHWRPLPAPLLSPTHPTAHAVNKTPTTPVPCRRCLRDIVPGTPALLISYDPFLDNGSGADGNKSSNTEGAVVGSPYRGPTAIYIHAATGDDDEGCELADVKRDFGGMVPEQQARWTLAARAFNGKEMMVGFEIVEGRDVVGACERLLLSEDGEERAEYVHLYYAAPGCFAVRVERS